MHEICDSVAAAGQSRSACIWRELRAYVADRLVRLRDQSQWGWHRAEGGGQCMRVSDVPFNLLYKLAFYCQVAFVLSFLFADCRCYGFVPVGTNESELISFCLT